MFWVFFSLTLWLTVNNPSKLSVPQQFALLSNQTTPVCPKPTWSTRSSRLWNVLQPPAQTFPAHVPQPDSKLAQVHVQWQTSVNKGKKDINQISLDLHKPLVHPWLLAAQTSHLLEVFLVLGDKLHIRPRHFTGENNSCSAQSSQHTTPQAAPAPLLPPPAPCCSSWPLPDPHSSSGLTAPALWVNPFPELFPSMLSPLDLSPLSCYLHPAFLTYPFHSGPLLLLPCQWPCWRDVSPAVVVSSGQLSMLLSTTFSPLSKQHYRLIIPTACKSHWIKSLFPSPFQLLTWFHWVLQTNQTLQSGRQGLFYPPHLLLCLFSGSRGKIPWLRMQSNSYWLLSHPHTTPASPPGSPHP